MSHTLDVDPRHGRPYTPRHGKPEPAPEPLARPAWANEHARPIPALVGERPTAVIAYPLPPVGDLEAMRLPSRHPQKARWWDVRFGQLGRALDAAKRVLR